MIRGSTTCFQLLKKKIQIYILKKNRSYPARRSESVYHGKPLHYHYHYITSTVLNCKTVRLHLIRVLLSLKLVRADKLDLSPRHSS